MAGVKTSKKKQSIVVHISTNSMIRILLIAAGIALLYLLWDIALIVCAALLFAALIDPFADYLEKYYIPRGIAVLIVYTLFFFLIFTLFYLVVPPTISEFQVLFSRYSDQLPFIFGDQPWVQWVSEGGPFLSENVSDIFLSIQNAGLVHALPELFTQFAHAFGAFFSFLLILILSFYLVIERNILERGFIGGKVPQKYRKIVTEFLPKMRDTLGYWFRGQLLIMFIIFVLVFIALSILGVPFALTLALLAGLFEVIPFLGPIVSAVPAIIVALSISPVQALLVAIVYFLIQQFESAVLTPKIMQRVVGLNPVISIISISIGFSLFGIVGALIAVPVATIVGLVIKEWQQMKGEG